VITSNIAIKHTDHIIFEMGKNQTKYWWFAHGTIFLLTIIIIAYINYWANNLEFLVFKNKIHVLLKLKHFHDLPKLRLKGLSWKIFNVHKQYDKIVILLYYLLLRFLKFVPCPRISKFHWYKFSFSHSELHGCVQSLHFHRGQNTISFIFVSTFVLVGCHQTNIFSLRETHVVQGNYKTLEVAISHTCLLDFFCHENVRQHSVSDFSHWNCDARNAKLNTC